MDNKYIEIDQIRLWIEQDTSIHISFYGNTKDPIELSEAEAEELAEALVEFAKILREG
jgi:hypothetical protein